MLVFNLGFCSLYYYYYWVP